MQEQACKLPKELQLYKVRFDHWYGMEHKSRTLTWLYDNGQVELRVLKGMSKKYLITVKVFQAAILLMFNQEQYDADNARFTVSDIYKTTNMSLDNLKASMERLCEPGKNILNK